jgi:hypothetical protein
MLVSKGCIRGVSFPFYLWLVRTPFNHGAMVFFYFLFIGRVGAGQNGENVEN